MYFYGLPCRAVNFPSHAFLGVDAISWLRSQISDMHEDDEAIAIMQRLMRDGFVAHIRGEQDFVVGSHLYFLREIGEPDEYSDLAEEWVEVGIISQSQKEVAKQLPASQQAQMKVSPSANNSRYLEYKTFTTLKIAADKMRVLNVFFHVGAPNQLFFYSYIL